jgi:hypothetical protein
MEVCLAKVPLRVAFFIWSAALGKILSMFNLRKRNIVVVDWCCMCKKCGETVDNLLLHCDLAGVMPRWVRDLLAYWRRKIGNSQSEALWKMIPLCLMWYIRNGRSFEDNERTVMTLKASIFILF